MSIIDVLLIIVIVILVIMHHMERKDLYNRIMSKDINQYKSIDKEVVKGVDGHRRAMNKWRKVDEDNESN